MPSVNSARVAGGAAPAPLHSIWPEPQSPVRQEPDPDPSKVQPVRAQKRPDQPVEAWKAREVSLGSSKPVLWSGGLPAFARMPGHTVYSHRLTNVKVAPITPEQHQQEEEEEATVSKKNIFLKFNKEKHNMTM